VAGFVNRGTSKWYFLASIASGTLAPTVAEVGAGTHLTSSSAANLMLAPEGFGVNASFIDVQAMASLQTLKFAGELQTQDSTINFIHDKTSNPILTTLARGVTGFIVENPTGVTIAAGVKVNVYPIEVGSIGPVRTASNEAAQLRAGFAITSIAAENIAVLA
jgi:hypothetical protein